MTVREKRLATIFFGLAVAVVAVLGIELGRERLKQVRAEKEEALLTLDSAELYLQMREQFADEMLWLEQHEPDPKTVQEVQPALQQFATREAEANGLTVLSPSFPPADGQAGHYGRARVRMTVTGTESSLYRWLHQLQSPEEFRTVISMDLTPFRDDDTKINCTIVVEQWFVPESSSA